MGRGHILRKMANGASGGFRQRVDGDVFVDSSGGFVKVPFAPVGSSLLASLLVKGGQMQPLPKASQKRSRGRSSKHVVAQVAAQVWSDVTGGDGVVLQDGQPVEVLSVSK